MMPSSFIYQFKPGFCLRVTPTLTISPAGASSSSSSVPTCSQRKPYRYWSEEKNLVAELRLFMDEQRLSKTHMPTASQLRQANRLDIVKAVQNHGGFARLASIIGLTCSRRSKLITSSENYQATILLEIQTAIAELSSTGLIPPGDMPTSSFLRLHGHISLINRIIAAGGFSYVSSKLSLRPARRHRSPLLETRLPRRPKYYWRCWRTVETELRNFARTHCDGYMPLQRQILQADRSDLMNAIRQHGGLSHVARRAGLQPPPTLPVKRSRGYWSDPAVLHAELLTFTARYGHPGLMPRRDQLNRAGRADIVYAIMRHGGFSAVAAAVHLVWHGPCSFWRVFRNFQRRLDGFIKAHSLYSKMPSIQLLHQHKRLDLVYGIALHGGVMTVASRMNLKVVYPDHDPGFWQSAYNVQRELEATLLLQPLESRRYMPTSVLLVQLGRADLATAIRDHGGWLYYAQRLGMRFAFDIRAQGFWRRECNVVQELLNYVEARYGNWEHPGKLPGIWEQSRKSYRDTRYVPSSEMLKRDGRSDIAFAIETFHGGMATFAQKHGFVVAEDVLEFKPAEHLQEWGRYVAALQRWIQLHGSQGIMPTKQNLITTGRYDLRYATYKHGGFEKVSQRLQLVYTEHGVHDWLPKWLGLQAGKMGLVMFLRQKERLSRPEMELLRNLETVLDGNGVGKVRSLMSKGDVVLIRGTGSTRRSVSRLKDMSTERRSHKVTKLSKIELDMLRRRYSHLPPDDLIAI